MAEYKGANDVVSIDDILDVCGKYITNKDSLTLIKQAYDFIMDKHKDQKRKSGEPYTNHLIWVAYILATLQTGPATIAAGLLHDVMEDCNVSHDEMVERFGLEITTLVEGVTKIGKMPFKDEADVYAENHRKIYIAMAKDIRVILIKFADRLHNMRTLQYMPPHKQKRIARETLEVYTPIAHRLGINDIKTELEDLSLYYLDPVAFKEISNLLAVKQEERKESVAKMMAKVKKMLDENNYEYRILGRAKSIYSIYKSLDELKDDVNEIIKKEYDEFIMKRVDNKNALITVCVAYVEFAEMHKNYFKCMFLSNNLKWTSIDDVLNEKWNQSTIINLVNKHSLTFDEAKRLFMNVWLYANGLATLIACNDLEIDNKEILIRIVKIYKELSKPLKTNEKITNTK